MKRFLDPCRGRRRSLALLAAGALAEPERGELENHVTGCARCRSLLTEWRGAVAPLVELAGVGGDIQPNEAAKNRWARAIRNAANPASTRTVAAGAPAWWREVIWSWRRGWAGLAALWVLILTGQVALHDDQSRPLAGTSSPVSKEIVLAFKERQVILAEIMGDQSHVRTSEADRPKRAPGPRTEHISEGMG